MGVYVHEKCHSCRASLTGGYVPNYYTMGEPVVQCTRCGALNSRANKCNEWELLSGGRKTKMVMLNIYWGLAYTVVAGLLLSALISFVNVGRFDSEASGAVLENNIVLIAVLSVLIGFLLSFRGLWLQIEASKSRMENPTYRARLASLGLIRTN